MKTALKLLAAGLVASVAMSARAELTIGVVVSLTGPASGLGIPVNFGFKLWPDTIGGEKVKMIVLDDATDPSTGVKNARRLVTEGPFAHTRHPRYIQVLLALIGWALLVNYASAYIVALAWIPLALLIVRLEEAELLRRFGVEYEEYAGRVARFWPHAHGANHRVKA